MGLKGGRGLNIEPKLKSGRGLDVGSIQKKEKRRGRGSCAKLQKKRSLPQSILAEKGSMMPGNLMMKTQRSLATDHKEASSISTVVTLGKDFKAKIFASFKLALQGEGGGFRIGSDG